MSHYPTMAATIKPKAKSKSVERREAVQKAEPKKQAPKAKDGYVKATYRGKEPTRIATDYMGEKKVVKSGETVEVDERVAENLKIYDQWLVEGELDKTEKYDKKMKEQKYIKKVSNKEQSAKKVSEADEKKRLEENKKKEEERIANDKKKRKAREEAAVKEAKAKAKKEGKSSS